MTAPLKAPFPWFGGKSRCAPEVWVRFGDVPNYVEPFAGSLAVLLGRPTHPGTTETVNDIDGYICNFWRALQADPAAVAHWADRPVHECDLHAIHSWLTARKAGFTARLEGDPEFYDPKVAGWWVWGLCSWIGGGWCSGKGPWTSENGMMALRNSGQGVSRKLPHLGDSGKGVWRQRPDLSRNGQGVSRQLPHLGDSGQARRAWLKSYMRGFADRMHRVRVCGGEWHRVCGPAVTFGHGLTGVFLDPPYADTAGRTKDIYATDSDQVTHAVRKWAIEQGDNPKMRIVLAGYEGDHKMPRSWTKFAWEAHGGYACISTDETKLGRKNRKRERLWFSPHCLPVRELELAKAS